MLTSQHWPSGARFLEEVDAFTHRITERAQPDNNQPHATFVQAAWTTAPGAPPCATCSVEIAAALTHAPRHETLGLYRDRSALQAACATFLHEGAALPGLRAHRLLPLLSYGTGKYEPPHPNVTPLTFARGGIFLHQDDPFADQSEVFYPWQFRTIAQKLLDAVDTLCARVPRPDAPLWHSFVPDLHPQNLPFCTPFRANTHDDALTIAPILAWDWTHAGRVLVHRDPQ